MVRWLLFVPLILWFLPKLQKDTNRDSCLFGVLPLVRGLFVGLRSLRFLRELQKDANRDSCLFDVLFMVFVRRVSCCSYASAHQDDVCFAMCAC